MRTLATIDASISLNEMVKRFLVALLCCFAISFVSWNALNIEVNRTPLFDSGWFMSVGYHLDTGSDMYLDVWDHKPPIVHMINAFARRHLGAQGKSIILIERVFAVVRSLCFFLVMLMLVGSSAFSFYASLAMTAIFFSFDTFEGGNLTEEYGVTFFLFGLMALIIAIKASGSFSKMLGSLFAGIGLALACWTKEPFVVPSLICFVFFCWHSRQGLERGAWKLPLTFLVGGFIVCFFMLLVISSPVGGFSAWMDATSFSFKLTSDLKLTFVERVSSNLGCIYELIVSRSYFLSFWCLIGLLSVFDSGYRDSAEGLPVLMLLLLAGDFVCTMLSGRFFGHYYLQIIPTVSICAGIGFAWFYRCVLLRTTSQHILFVTVFILAVMCSDMGVFTELASRSDLRGSDQDALALEQYIKTHTSPNDYLWSLNQCSWIYAVCERKSPSKYLAAFAHCFSDTILNTGCQKRQLMMEKLQAANPPLIVSEGLLNLSPFDDVGLITYLRTKYEVKRLGRFTLFLRKKE